MIRAAISAGFMAGIFTFGAAVMLLMGLTMGDSAWAVGRGFLCGLALPPIFVGLVISAMWLAGAWK